MSKCVKCGTELISNKEEHCNICPNCGMKYITSSTKDIGLITDLSAGTETTDNTTSSNSKSIFDTFKKDKWSKTPLIGMIISFIIYWVFKICLYSKSISVELYTTFDIFCTIALIIFIISLLSYMIYKRIDKYDEQIVVPMQKEISNLKKEIENLKKQIK